MAKTGQLYHLVSEKDWRAVAGLEYFPPTYDQDGFTHLTADPKLLLDVGNQFYTSVPGKWLLLCLDPSKLKAQVKYEAAAPVGSTPSKPEWSEPEAAIKYPHLYGGIDTDAVVSELTVERDEQGKFLSIPALSVH